MSYNTKLESVSDLDSVDFESMWSSMFPFHTQNLSVFGDEVAPDEMGSSCNNSTKSDAGQLDKDVVNPGSVVLSGEMMFRYMGWTEAADLIIKGLNGAVQSKRVTYDFERQMEGATKVKCSEFGDEIIKNM